MSVEPPHEHRGRLRGLMEIGAAAMGAAAGQALEMVIPTGGVVGAASGAMLTETLSNIGEEISRRVLAPNEERRIGTAFFLIADEIKARLEAGDTPRQDGFFDARPSGRNSEASELLEGVLLTARDAFEARKISLLAELYSNIAFDPSVSSFEANHVLALADQMTYMDFVGLHVLSTEENRNRLAAPFPYPDVDDSQPGFRPEATPDATALVSIMFRLHTLGLLTGIPSDPAWGSVAAIHPRRVRLSWMGVRMAQLCNLTLISAEDSEAFYTALKRTARDAGPDQD